MGTDHAVGDLTCFQQPDQVGPGHVQEVGRTGRRARRDGLRRFHRRLGRAVAVTLVAATQKVMGQGAVRSQMNLRIRFRVRERRDVDLILGQGMLNAGMAWCWQQWTAARAAWSALTALKGGITVRVPASLLTRVRNDKGTAHGPVLGYRAGEIHDAVFAGGIAYRE